MHSNSSNSGNLSYSKHSKHSKHSNVSSQSQTAQSAAIDEAIESVLSQSRTELPKSSANKSSQDTDVIGVNSGSSDVYKQISDLKQIINRQNIVINTVVSRLNFVLSMFGIDEVSMSMSTSVAPNRVVDITGGSTVQVTQSSIPPSQQLASTIDGGTSTMPITNCAEPSSHTVINTSAKQSYSSVTGRNIQPQQPQKQLSQFRQSLVAAVYIDQRDRDSRASSFIISGLPASAVHSDKSIVTELCSNEFNIQVDIVNTKRLGKASSSSSIKVQPLLVTVKNVEHAKQIISLARHLRHSTTPFVRDNVYINPNLTKAEASAAYELRCRRREGAARRTAADVPVAGYSVNHLAPHSSGVEAVLPGSSTVSASALNAAVPSFVPAASTSSCS